MGLTILTFLSAFSISSIAAYFSIVGLAALFSATFLPVVIMGSVLELGKLIATIWLHRNWRNSRVSFLIKAYLIAAISALMLITAIGIYGYLSKGHLSSEAPVAKVELQIDRIELQITQLQEENSRLQTQLDQLDASIQVFFDNDLATKGLAARKDQEPERENIRLLMENNFEKISTLQDSLLPLKETTTEVEAKLGPVKYVAALFGWNDAEIAVRMVILVLMFAFDPLAVVLVIAGSISLEHWIERRRELKSKEFNLSKDNINNSKLEKQKILYENQLNELMNKNSELQNKILEYENTINEMNEKIRDHNSQTEQEKIIQMLEQNPDIIEDLIEIISSYKKEEYVEKEKTKSKDRHWLDNL